MILVTGFNPYSAVSWYRGAGVYQYLGECIASGGQFVTWDQMQRFDTIVMIRPATGDATTTIDNAKEMNKRVIVDFDDDVFHTNPCSPAYETTIKKEWRDSAFYCLERADVVTVSTQRLADVFVNMGIDCKKIFVIPNAYNDIHKPFVPTLNLTNRWLIRADEYSWNDLLGQFNSLIKSSTEYDLVTVGNVRLFDKLIRIKEEYDFIPVPFFFERLASMACRVMVKPLMDNLFNKSKSNCSWIEATVAGCVLVAPERFYEFDKPGIVNEQIFYNGIKELMSDDTYAETMFNQAAEYIRDNLLLSKVNELRKELLATL